MNGFLFGQKLRYTPTKYLLKTWLPKRLVQRAAEQNWLDSLCYFVWFKSKYHRPIFYNYSLRKVARLLGCSPATVKFHIDRLSSEGLLCVTGRHLVLKSNNSLRREDNFMVPIGIVYNKANQRNLLRWALTLNNLHHQEKAIAKKNNALRFHNGDIESRADYKICKKAAQRLPDKKQLESSLQNVLTLSNKSFGRIANRSLSTGIKIQKAFNNLGLIKSTKRIKGIDMPILNRRAFFACGFDARYFITPDGLVCKRLPNKVEIIGGEIV